MFQRCPLDKGNKIDPLSILLRQPDSNKGVVDNKRIGLGDVCCLRWKLREDDGQIV